MRIKLKNPDKLGGGGLRVFKDHLRFGKRKKDGLAKLNEVEGHIAKSRRSIPDNSASGTTLCVFGVFILRQTPPQTAQFQLNKTKLSKQRKAAQ